MSELGADGPGARSRESTKRPFIGISLKMYFGHRQTLEWCRQIAELPQVGELVKSGRVELVVIPSFPELAAAGDILIPQGVALGAQNVFWHDTGPYTGEVSAGQLKEVGCGYIELGHAERRRLFGETDEIIRHKVAATVRAGLTPMLCVGEETHMPVSDASAFCIAQVRSATANGLIESPIVVAYEPVWAIGQIAPAPDDHIRAVCGAIRDELSSHPGAADSRVVYGGSAGTGLLERIGDSVDGLFLGRYAHNASVVGGILSQAALF